MAKEEMRLDEKTIYTFVRCGGELANPWEEQAFCRIFRRWGANKEEIEDHLRREISKDVKFKEYYFEAMVEQFNVHRKVREYYKGREGYKPVVSVSDELRELDRQLLGIFSYDNNLAMTN